MIDWVWISCLLLALHPQTTPDTSTGASDARAAELRRRIEAASRLPLQQTDLPIRLPSGQTLGMVSWMAYDGRTGLTWIIQRGKDAPPVLAIDRSGTVVHAFGKGLFSIPHAIRVGPDGNVWTVDAGTSKVMEFTPAGKVLLQLDVSRKAPSKEDPFSGATDVAFARGHIFITDGYVNARVLEYTQEGKKVREWGTRGSGPGQFSLPHSIVSDGNTLYVTDRENGRVEEFDLNGRFLREIDHLGRVYAVQVGPHGTLWATMAPMNEPPGSSGWVVELDAESGKIIGYVSVTEAPALHALDVTPTSEPMTDIGNRVILFKRPQHAP